MMLASVDIRDVAEAHLIALEKPGLSGKRILINQESLWMNEIAQILDEEFKQYGYSVPTRSIGYCPLKLFSYFDSQVKLMIVFCNAECYVDNTLSKELLGIEYRGNIKQTIIDMGYSLIE